VNPFQNEDTALDAEIARVYQHLSHFSAEDEEYQKASNQLSKLYAIKNDQNKLKLDLYQSNAKLDLERDQFAQKIEMEKDQAEAEQQLKSKSFLKSVDPNTVLAVTGNLAIALLVVKYEQTGVIATKVQSFMKKI